MLKAWIIRHQMQKALDAAWRNPEGTEARQELFPDGKPTPEQFIKVVAEEIKRERERGQGQQ